MFCGITSEREVVYIILQYFTVFRDLAHGSATLLHRLAAHDDVKLMLSLLSAVIYLSCSRSVFVFLCIYVICYMLSVVTYFHRRSLCGFSRRRPFNSYGYLFVGVYITLVSHVCREWRGFDRYSHVWFL